MSAPKKIIFYHNCFAIPAEIWLDQQLDQLDIHLKQVMAFDLPEEMHFTVHDNRYLQFPDFFHEHMETLYSLVESIRALGYSIYVRTSYDNNQSQSALGAA